jgi:RNA polymerase sigma factor (sigma-70 family)
MPANLSLVGYVHQLAAKTAQAEATDRQLLERFARDRDEDAFRVLIGRHGPLVLGVSRRALGRREDAEDCFQATFLVLARKAGAVHWHDSVAGWLHQVATRLAAEIRGRDAQRRRRERLAAIETPTGETRTGTTDPAALRELGAVLDEEVQRLPGRSRAAFLLCHLYGKTRDQAARQLGLSLRTLERRLQDGRDLLCKRLARRGVTLSAAVIAWGIAQEAISALPAPLARVTAQAATSFSVATVASRAGALAADAVRVVVWHKIGWAAGLLVAAGLFALAAGVQNDLPAADAPEAPAPAVWDGGGLVGPKDDLPPKPAARAGKLQEAGTAAAVQQGLNWIVRQQKPDGGWSLNAGHVNDVAATAFGLLPLLESGEGRDAKGRFGPHASAVERGLKWLAGMPKADGSFAGGMYAHALATMALCDGFRLTGDAKLEKPAQVAIDYIVDAQHDGGGWRYAPKQAGDTSVTSWQVLALARGKQAGLKVPAEVFKKASAYLDSVASEDGLSYPYAGKGNPGSPAMTAGGLLCRHLLGSEARHPTLVKGVAKLAQRQGEAEMANAYYFHFATRLMQAVGGPEWDAWDSKLASVLLQRQERGGSWSAPAGDPFGQAGGRLMVTSLSLLSLQTCGRLTVPPAGTAKKLTVDEAASAWVDLAAGDFATVKKAMQLLIGAPGQTVPLFRDRLRPVPVADVARVLKLIAALEADAFEDRAAAFKELRGLGERAAGPLRQALKVGASLEQKRRLEQLLEAIEAEPRSAEWLRQLRAVQILELAGTPAARQLLQTLAKGAPGARLTQAANEALDRLSR